MGCVTSSGPDEATHADVDHVADLAAARRRDYESHQPLFWRQAEDAVTRHTAYLHGLVDDPDHIFLVARGGGRARGFVIGRLVPAPAVYEPGGLTCLVDDFAVATPDDWTSVGLSLLRAVVDRARARGAVQVVVVTGRHDDAKRHALEAAGLTVASEWWFAPIDRLAVRGPTPTPG
jgi:GNAT superfamily N-acetyltransferase